MGVDDRNVYVRYAIVQEVDGDPYLQERAIADISSPKPKCFLTKLADAVTSLTLREISEAVICISFPEQICSH